MNKNISRAEIIAEGLVGHKSGNGWMAKCPCHDDSRASLSIRDGDTGAPLLKCHAGCSQDALIAELDRRGLWPRKSNGDGKKKVDAEYDYRTENGDLLFQVVRFAPKDFRQRRPDGDGWSWSVKGITPVPYRLPEIKEAIATGRTIMICEGEKDVDHLWDLGIPATTNAGGAGKWRDDLNQHFAGADVVIIPDSDQPGRAHADAVAGKLKPIAKRVRILELPDLPAKGDVSDWIKAGGTSEALYELADAAPDWKLVTETTGTTDETFWHGEAKMVDTPWLVKDMLPEVGTALLSGQWGLFKSFTLLDLGSSVITGRPFAGRRIMRRGGVLVFAPEGAYTFPKRLEGLAARDKLPSEPQPFAWKATCPALLAPGALEELKRKSQEIEQQMMKKWGVPLVLIAVDTLVAAANFKDESDAAQGQAAMNVLNELAKTMKACVVAVDHFGKAVETGTRGTSAKEAAADAVLALLGDRTVTGKVSNCRMAIRKLRDGASGEEINFTAREVVLGTDRNGDPIITRTIEWDVAGGQTTTEKQKPKRWNKTTNTLRRALMVVLASDDAKITRPFGMEGPEVRAVDRESLRSEYYKIKIVDSETPAKAAEAKKKAFGRALTDAAEAGLIGVREVNGQMSIWLVAPEDGSNVADVIEG